VSRRTVEFHLTRIFAKLGVSNRLEAVIYCSQKAVHSVRAQYSGSVLRVHARHEPRAESSAERERLEVDGHPTTRPEILPTFAGVRGEESWR
jgi:ATP/maltotriose-dependent transcriptional regulator MalT